MRPRALAAIVLSVFAAAPGEARAQGGKITFGPSSDEDRVVPKRLANGLDVVVVEKHNAPIVTIEIAVRAGAFIEDEKTNGLSHLYEHMFFKGNKRIPTQEAYMKRMAELGISFNGTTSNERVNYFITLPSKNLADGARFMADSLLTPNFDQTELEKERLVVIGEYDRAEARPEYWLHHAMEKAAWGPDALRKNPLGVRETILGATREIMQGFKDTYYIPNNALVCIVGDVNPTEAYACAERCFGPSEWKEGKDPFLARPRPPIQRIEKSQAVVVSRERAVPVLAATWNGPDTDRDARATVVADVLTSVLDQPRGRFQKAFKDGKLATSVNFGYRTQRDSGELNFRVQTTADPRNVRDALLAEIAAMAAGGYFQDDDLGIARQSMRAGRAYEREAGSTLCHSLTSIWATASLEYHAAYLEEVDKVTTEDLREFVRDYIVGRPWVIGVLMDPSALEKSGLDEKNLLETSAGAGTSLTADVKAFALGNGVRAIARHEAGAPIWALAVFIDGGSSLLTKETQGLDRFALSLALEGSKETPRDRFKREIAALGARVGSDGTFDESNVGISAPQATFQAACDLALQCLRSPELSETALEQKRAERMTGFKRENIDADALLRKLANAADFAGHPYANRPDGTEETVKTFDQAACAAAVGRLVVPSRLLVVLVSSLGDEEAKAFLEERFAWLKPGEGPAFARPAIPRVKTKPGATFEKRALPTTYIRGTFAMPSPQEEGFLASRVLIRILHDRFWEAIRTKNALSYAPNASATAFRANVGVLYATSSQPKKCVEVMHEELRKIKEELVPASDLAAVIAKDFTGRAMRGETASGHALALGSAELISGSWRRYYEEPQDLVRITPEQVREQARKLLVDIHWTIVGPEPIDEKVLGGEGAARTGE